jgi:hypothetical protein
VNNSTMQKAPGMTRTVVMNRGEMNRGVMNRGVMNLGVMNQGVTVDQVAIEERVASLAKRSIKKATKVSGLKLAVAMMDLTTLEGKDTPGKVRALCRKALTPLDSDPSIGPCAAICVYPNLVPVAKEALAGSTVKVASVATAFPSGQSPPGEAR